jgi:acetyltransferase-like isoleucine patch superfamily enzyme
MSVLASPMAMEGVTRWSVDRTAVFGCPPMHRDYRTETHHLLPGIGDGVRVEAFVVIECGTVRNGEDCELASRCVVGGHCVIGDRVRLGIGTVLRPGVTVGDGARTGCGAVVVDDIPPGELWVGNPARKLRDQ